MPTTTGDDDITGTAGRDLLYGGAGDDNLFGGDGNDVLYGGIGSDELYGGSGDDQLSGGEGADRMVGGDGNDTYYVDDIGDVVIELSNGGIDTVVSSLSNYALKGNVEILVIAEGAATDVNGRSNGSGNELDNSIKGNSGANILQGHGGNDSIYGLGGDDILNGGDGNDILDGGDGNDLVSYKDAGAAVTVNLALTAKQDTIGAGVDLIRNVENLEGSAFADILTGNAQANTISGLGGGDTIRGAGGNDTLIGGSGNDKFIFDSTATNGFDTIRGFEQGVGSNGDKLVFSTADGYAAGATLISGAPTDGDAHFIYNATTHVLSYDADGNGAGAAVDLAVFLPGVALQQSDFVIL